MKLSSARRVIGLLALLGAPSVAAAAGESLHNPFPCVQAGAPASTRPIVIVSANAYQDAQELDDHLRAIAAAEAGSPRDVRVLLSGWLHDPISLAYREARLGTSTRGRVAGLEEEESFAVASLLVTVLSLRQLETLLPSERDPGDAAREDSTYSEFQRRGLRLETIELRALRQLYLVPALADAWRERERPAASAPRIDARHVALIESVFDTVVAIAADPGSGPAPDDADFDLRVLAPNRAGLEDGLAFLFVVRGLLDGLLARAQAGSFTELAVAPEYRPDFRSARRIVRDDVLRLGPEGDAVMRDLCVRWRHYAIVERIAEAYCSDASGRGLEVVLGSGEAPEMERLLHELLGADFPIVVKRIDELE